MRFLGRRRWIAAIAALGLLNTACVVDDTSDGGDGDGQTPTKPSTSTATDCENVDLPITDMSYTVVVEQEVSVARRKPAGDTNPTVGEYGSDASGLRFSGRCEMVDGSVWWEERLTEGVWLDSRFLELDPEAHENESYDNKYDVDQSPDPLDLVEEASGSPTTVCDPANPEYSEYVEFYDVEPSLGGTARAGRVEQRFPEGDDRDQQEFLITVEAFDTPDVAAEELLEDFFSSPICLELTMADAFEQQSDTEEAGVGEFAAESVGELPDILDEEDVDQISEFLGEIGDALAAGDPPASAGEKQLARVVTIEVQEAGDLPESEFTGHFLIDPRIPYNGYDVYLKRQSQWVSAYGLSRRGTLGLALYNSKGKPRDGTMAGPGRYTKIIATRARKGGVTLVASAHNSSVTYDLWGTWRGESHSK